MGAKERRATGGGNNTAVKLRGHVGCGETAARGRSVAGGQNQKLEYVAGSAAEEEGVVEAALDAEF